jgi:putative membrane protein insertion efficiency factor
MTSGAGELLSINLPREENIPLAQRLARVPARLLLGAIRVYQATLSPVLPVITLGRCACRFAPTCSHYAAEAVRTHGALAGSWLALRRLAKCTPLHPGGIDPVPPRRCVRSGPSR